MVPLTHPAAVELPPTAAKVISQMPEVIRKPQPTLTVLLTVRLEAAVKKDYTKAREVADRQHIDLSAMMSNALREVFNAVIATASGKVAALSDHRGND